LNALLERFEALDTQVLGVSVDSKYCHKAWAKTFGGIRYPLLQDFHPKGSVAARYGLYLGGEGITDRATVWIDKEGIVRGVESVGPDGARVPARLLERCAELFGKKAA